MGELFKTRIHGLILHGDTAAACPRCRTRQGLTVYGYLGGPARLECPCGEDFAVPPPFDAVLLLNQTVTHARYESAGITFGDLPDPDHFC